MLSFGFKIIPAPPVLFHGMLNISLFISKFYEWTRLKRFKTSYYFSFFFFFLLKLHSIFRLLFCTVFLLYSILFFIFYIQNLYFFLYSKLLTITTYFIQYNTINSIQICKYKVKCLSNVELRYRESG